MTIIPLAQPSLAGSSGLPGGFGRAVLKRLPIWPCSVRGFACHPCCHGRGALLPHLFTIAAGLPPDGGSQGRLCVFCATFLQVTLTGRYPAHCPAEFGLSSPRLASSRLAPGGPATVPSAG